MGGVETFVVRVFVAADSAELEIAGTVRHIGSGAEQPFHGEQGLVAAVRGGLPHGDADRQEAEKGGL
jgi:hypothetical protein